MLININVIMYMYNYYFNYYILGQFSIVPDSCHEFDADMYVYLT